MNKNDLKDGKGSNVAAIVFATLGTAGIVALSKLHSLIADAGEAKPKAEESATVYTPLNHAFDAIVGGITTGAELTLIGLSATGLGALGFMGYKVRLELLKEEMIALKIKPKQGMKVNTERVARMARDFRQLYHSLWNKRVWVKWQVIRDEEGKFTFQVICPKKHAATVSKYLKTCYSDSIIKEVPVQIPEFYDPYDGEVTHMKLASKDKTLGIRSDFSNHMGDILLMMEPKTIMEFTFSPTHARDIRKAGRSRVKELEAQKKKGKDTQAEIDQVRERYTGKPTGFDCFIDIWAYSGLEALAGRLSDRTERSNKLSGYPYIYFERLRSPFNYEMRHRVLAKWQSSKLTDKELANFLMLPPEGHPVWEHIQCELPKPKVTNLDFNGDIGIGYIDSDDPDQDGRVARLQVKTLTNHGLIAGKSGGGKGSTLSMLLKLDFLKQWIEDKQDSIGMTICDPHGTDLYLTLSYLLDLERQGYDIPWNRVKCVSFGDLGAYHYPVAMNVLHMFEGDQIDRIAEDTEHVILSAFNSENLSKGVSDLQRALQCLLGSGKSHSILDITRLFEYSPEAAALRMDLIEEKSFKNHEVKRWLNKSHQWIAKNKKDMPISSIDTRLASLTTKQSIQRFFCREGNYFNVSSILANGDLVLIDFKGAPKECYKLVAGWLAKKYYDESQRRGEGGRPHLLVFDEVQKFDVSQIFEDIIKENRKFNMGLILMTQEIEKLDESLANSITSNAGFILSVRQESGAPKMQKLLGKPFTVEELTSLENGLEAAVKSNDGKARLRLEFPQFLLNGKPTWKDSAEEKQAMAIAKEKFRELLARDHKTVAEADQEVYRFVFGVDPQAEAAATTEKPQSNVVDMEEAMEKRATEQETPAERGVVRKRKRI